MTSRFNLGARWLGAIAAAIVAVIAVTTVLLVGQHRHSASAEKLPAKAAAGSLANAASVYVVPCVGDQPESQPAQLNLTCGDGSITFDHIVWTSWGTTSAVGTGILGQNGCDPNCAQGAIATEPATVTLTGVGPVADVTAYLNLTVTPDAPNPQAFAPITQTLPQ